MKRTIFYPLLSAALILLAGTTTVAHGQDFNGTLDCQVACENNLDAIKRFVPHATVKAYEGLNHFFQTCTEWKGSANYGAIKETMSPEVLQDIVNWLQQVVKQ